MTRIVFAGLLAVALAGRGLATAPIPVACGTVATPPATWDHVIWIWFENHGARQVVGSGSAPFMTALARGCGLSRNYHGIAHPSLPNYIAATSGLAGDALSRFANDCNATGPCVVGADSIFAEAPSWGAYAESMPRPCTHWFAGLYAASHDPAVYYTALDDCPMHAVGLRPLFDDLAADRLPAFAFVTPNMCHSMHNCSVGTGDAWLRRILPRIVTSPPYQEGRTAIFVTFDESDRGSADNRVATIVVSPSTVPGTRSNERFDHYALLRTTEEMLGIPHLLGRAAHAPSMRAAFHL